ncbi:DUF4174 domain-containing protein [Vibrio breoganii]|uniref:DUF4174 domain-containing protein n=2 Tax=Vibrio breoganii TaxID=553239 RepID=UPI000364A1DC|nr:DUF4174 domain-containing protein [Vibrio breoganii]OED96895.1 hypothetical protein A1QG_16685 [Vibrio breoganii ZF-29]PMF75346.1 hypothetical protein BCV08_17500 [Vibrio breoganii]PMG03176.1 hypothetical protein BCV00_03260 [Vibrio breoganii]PMG97117.1 hypothetical protein BCU79_05025 [Vibrio breoganii]PMH19063.1 hypothetical protein BCU74_06945 [Vibrio breoganii]
MRILIWVISMTAMSVLASSKSDASFQQLSEMKWQYRILLIQDRPDYQQTLTNASEEIADRHLVWFLVSPNQVISNLSDSVPEPLQQDIRQRISDKPVVLIGKDGGIKMREERLSLPSIFSTIDSMPMRQAEMNSKLL